MIDAGAGVVDLIVRRADPIGQHHGGTLHRVAQTGDLDKSLSLDGGTQHRHRVGVVEQHGVRAVAAPYRAQYPSYRAGCVENGRCRWGRAYRRR